MTFSELIRTAERQYRELLLTTMNHHREKGMQVISEPALLNSDGDVVHEPGEIDLPLRYDFVTVGLDKEPQPYLIDPLIFDLSEPLTARWLDSLEIKILSFSWDSLHIRCPSESVPPSFDPIKQWFFGWFDPRDDEGSDQDGLLGVVHFLSDPKYVDGAIELCVDLGSAHRDSLAGLFDAIVALGITHCIISADEINESPSIQLSHR